MGTKSSMSIAAQAARNLGGFVPNKIFVGGVPITVTEEQFRQCFETYGSITKVELHALRGFGYITYDTVEAVDACLEKYEEHYLSKKWVEVKRSIPRELIDAYEREQRRLHTLHNESSPAVGSATSDRQPAKAESPAAPSSSTTAPAGGKGAWGSAPSSAPAVSASSRPATGGASPASASPPASAWGRPLPPPGSTPATRNRPAPGGTPAGAGAGGYGGGATPAGSMGRIAQLKEMGFSDEVSRRVLAECAWDVNKAIDKLLLTGGILEEVGDEPEVAEGEAAPGAEENGDAAAASAPAWQSSAPENSTSPSGANGRNAARSGAAFFPERGSAAASPSAAKSEPPAGHRSWAAAAAATPTTPSSPRSAGALAAAAVEVPQATATSEAPSSHQAAEEDSATAEDEEPSAEPPAPPKRLERAARTWNADDASMLGVTENEFVNVWTETATENGWIHAELASNQAKVGWLPSVVLQKLPEGQRWMKTKQPWEAMDPSQCSVGVDTYVNVWVSSLTKEGWTYVEALDQQEHKGWLPSFCLVWNDN
eukprot:TRINITY_DN21868_c0_g1_i1.p1 TRINITY_DN21868_c0_g1~~TRINITY_DN21868_c0_g1_i1.p1  ORF type:complete len:623 (+),score=115.85 TRINITY_DN21868_c0_g1_i1:249-1871(+)